MLKRVLHAANQVVTHEETHTGKELVIENTVNALAEVRARGDSWQGSTTGAQLFPFSGTVDNVNFTATIEKNEITITSKVSSSGILLISLPIDAKVGETYIFSAEYEKGLANIDVFRPDGTRENVVPKNTPFTAKEGYTYKAKIYLNASGSTVGIGDTRTYRNVMFNAGSSVLPWEPYTGNAPSPSPEYPQDIISVSGTLKSTNNGLNGRDKIRESQISIPELRAIPGTDVRDELVVYEDGTGKIVRRVKRRILKNTDNWVQQGEDTTLMFTTLIGGANIDNAVICNFGLHDNKSWQTEQFAYIGKHKRLLIKLGYVGVETIDEWKEKLKTAYESGIPFYVDYALETPTEELLTAAEVQGILRTHQYHTEIGFEGLDEHLEPEVEVKCKVLGR